MSKQYGMNFGLRSKCMKMEDGEGIMIVPKLGMDGERVYEIILKSMIHRIYDN